MPRGRAKKQSAEVEALPPEDSQPSQKVIKHKTEWVEVVEDAPEEIGEEFDDTEIDDKPRKKTRNAIQEMRKKLRAQGVTPSSNLRLYIERYIHSETDAGGSWAETEFCTKYSTTEEHVLDKGYMDTASKWGPGKYRITIRMDNRILDAFDVRISAAPTSPMVQHVNPNDPNSPQVIFQTSDGQQAMPSLKEVWKAQREALKEQLEMAKLMREAYGLESDKSDKATMTGATDDPETLLLRNLANNDKFMDKINSGVIKKILGDGSVDDDPSWSAVGMEAVKSGQLGVAIEAAFKGLSGLINMILPRRDNNNGQAQMAQTPVQNQTPQGANQQQRSEFVSDSQGALQQGNLQMGSSQTLEREAPGNVAGDVLRGDEPQMVTTPEEAALRTLIDNCMRNVPVRVAFDRLMAYADMLNDQAPQYSIDGYISMFAAMPTEAALEFVKSQPNGEQIASLPHAKEWTEALQKLIKESQEGEEE